MKMLLLFLIILINKPIYSQIVFGEFQIGQTNSASWLNSNTTFGEFSPNLFNASYALEIMWDSRRKKLTQSGMKLQLQQIAVTTDFQTSSNIKLGLYYSKNFGFDYSIDGKERVGIGGSTGPHINLVSPDDNLNEHIMTLGISNSLAINFRLFNHSRAAISFDFAVDLLGIGNTLSANDHRYITQGFNIGFSTPLSKINGRSYWDRRKDLEKFK